MSARTKSIEYLKYGFNPIPIKEGTKVPKVAELKIYFSKMITVNQLKKLVGSSIGIIGGRISGNLLILDFDNKRGDIDKTFKQFMKKIKKLNDKYNFPIETTPSGGYHLFLRCTDPVGGAKKLAQIMVKGKKTAIIETKGEGGYVVVDPTPGYSFNGTPLIKTPTITFDEMKKILKVAKKFSDIKSEPKSKEKKVYDGPTFTEEEFNQVEIQMMESLKNNGWKYLRRDKENEFWQRPGKEKSDDTNSAGYNGEVFNVFSTSADPLEDRGYHPIEVIAHLDHGGDIFLAKRSLGLTKKAKNLPAPTDTTSEPKTKKKSKKKSIKEFLQMREGSQEMVSDSIHKEDDEPFLYWMDHEFLHPGTVNIVHGQTGQHKSRISGLIASAILNTDIKFNPVAYNPDKLLGLQFNTEFYNQTSYTVYYFDTERHATKSKTGKVTGMFNNAIQEICHFANIKIADVKAGKENRFIPVTMKKLDPSGKLEGEDFVVLMMQMMKTHTKVFPKDHAVFILDNLLDLINANDDKQVKRVLGSFNDLADDTDGKITTILTLHENPTRSLSEEQVKKITGWLGTVGKQKSALSLGIKKKHPVGKRAIGENLTPIYQIETTKQRMIAPFNDIFLKTFLIPAPEALNKTTKLVGLCPPTTEELREYDSPNKGTDRIASVDETFLAVVQKQDQDNKAGLKKNFSKKDTVIEVIKLSGASESTVRRDMKKYMLIQKSRSKDERIYERKIIGTKNKWMYTCKNPLKSKIVK